jgi:hypothetical protein
MVARAFLIAVLSVPMAVVSPRESHAQRKLTVIDNSPFLDGPGDVAFVPGINEVVTMSFLSDELVSHRLHIDGRVEEVDRIPAGPEPRAVAFAFGGDLAIIANSIANELGVFEVGDDGHLREINRVSSGGLNPYDVAVGYNDIVVVANRDSDEIRTFRANRRGGMMPIDSEPTGIDPHVVAVSSHGFVGVANQTDRSISLFELKRRGRLKPGPTIPLGDHTPRTLAWQGRNLFVALDAPSGEDVIKWFRLGNRIVDVRDYGDTPVGAFVTDLEPNADGFFAVTVNRNDLADPTDDANEVRAYRMERNRLVLDAAVQTPGALSFKQITARRIPRGRYRVLTTEFQGNWLRSLLYETR